MCPSVDMNEIRYAFIVYMLRRRPEVLHSVGDNALISGLGRGLWSTCLCYTASAMVRNETECKMTTSNGDNFVCVTTASVPENNVIKTELQAQYEHSRKRLRVSTFISKKLIDIFSFYITLLNPEIAQVVVMIIQGKQWPVNPTYSILWLLVFWSHKGYKFLVILTIISWCVWLHIHVRN